MEYIQKIVLSEVQKSHADDKMDSVMFQPRVTYASCVPCPAGTSGGLCQHVFAPESSSPAASLPGSD